MDRNPPEIIVWGIDPTAELEIQLRVMSALATLAKSWNAVIEPVCVIKPRHLHSDRLETLFEDLVSKINLPGFGAPYAIECRTETVAAKAETLAMYAAEKSARMLVVGSHARHGLQRALLGSFSESLILISPVPVYVVNPHSASCAERIERILFPTDFSASSRNGLELVTSVAREMAAELVIFSRRKPNTAEDFVNKAEAWATWVAGQNVRVQLVLDEGPDNTAEAIVRYARTNTCDMISMISQAGLLKSNLLASTTREVARTAGCPVWVQHTFPYSSARK